MAVKGERFEMRIDPDTLSRLDTWRAAQADIPSRAEAIRRLIELGLSLNSSESVQFSDGEKLLLLMMRDLFRHVELTQAASV